MVAQSHVPLHTGDVVHPVSNQLGRKQNSQDWVLTASFTRVSGILGQATVSLLASNSISNRNTSLTPQRRADVLILSNANL